METREIGTAWIAQAVAGLEDASDVIEVMLKALEPFLEAGEGLDATRLHKLVADLRALRQRLIEVAAPF